MSEGMLWSSAIRLPVVLGVVPGGNIHQWWSDQEAILSYLVKQGQFWQPPRGFTLPILEHRHQWMAWLSHGSQHMKQYVPPLHQTQVPLIDLSTFIVHVSLGWDFVTMCLLPPLAETYSRLAFFTSASTIRITTHVCVNRAEFIDSGLHTEALFHVPVIGAHITGNETSSKSGSPSISPPWTGTPDQTMRRFFAMCLSLAWPGSSWTVQSG